MTATNNTTETTAADSITTIESLVREARRRGFHLHGGFNPPDIIPLVEASIAEHNQRERGFTELSGDYIEWKQTMDNLQEFRALLKSLPDRLPHEKYPPFRPTNGESTRERLTTVAHPSDQASDPRRTPVPHPSKDASDASADAFTNGHVVPPSGGSPSDQPDSSQSLPVDESLSARIDRERAEYLALVLRESSPSKSPIDDFPPERQQTLYQLTQELPLTAVVKMLAAPEPVGWNFQTCDTSLRRFKKRYEKKLRSTELMAAFTEARRFLAETAHDEQSYMDAARRLLKIRLYKNAADPEGSAEELELLMSLLDRQRRTDLAERRVKVAEQKATQP
jgi:hypothetical protein